MANDGFSVTSVYQLNIDYGTTIEQSVADANFHLTEKCITSVNYPSQESGKSSIKLVLVKFNQYLTTPEVIQEMEKMGLRPATLKELLCFTTLKPGVQLKWHIAALGSSFKEPGKKPTLVNFPVVFGYEGKRILGNYESDEGMWSPAWYFAGVQK